MNNPSARNSDEERVKELVEIILREGKMPDDLNSQLQQVPETERADLLKLLHSKNPPVLGTGTVS